MYPYSLFGLVKMSRYQTNAGDPTVLHMFIEASSVFQHKESESSMGGHCLDFTEKDYRLVEVITYSRVSKTYAHFTMCSRMK